MGEKIGRDWLIDESEIARMKGDQRQMATANAVPQRRRRTARELWAPDVHPKGKQGVGIDLDLQVYPDGAVYFTTKNRSHPTANAAQACSSFAEMLDFMMREASKKQKTA